MAFYLGDQREKNHQKEGDYGGTYVYENIGITPRV